MTNIIYGLFDPIDETLRYIGRTSNQEKRLIKHCQGNDGTKEKRIWIRHLTKVGLNPIMEVIEEYDTPEELPKAEEHWYWFWRFLGASLYNDQDFIGNNGSLKGRKVSDETRKRMSNAKKLQSVETRSKISSFHKGKPKSDKTKAKISAANSGRKLTNEHKEKISDALILSHPMQGRHHTDDSKAKMSDAHKNISLETRAKMSDSKKGNTNHKGKHHSDEAKTKMSISHKGKTMSIETRAKMSAAKKGKAPWNKGKNSVQ